MSLGWLDGWKYRIKLTIDHDLVGTNITQFPALVYLSAASGIGDVDVSRVFTELGANSLKLAVTKSDGETEMYVEIEKWDNANSKAWLWVSKSDWTVSSTADTVIYLYYDSTHADNSTYVGVVGSTPGKAVWETNVKFVSHMSDDPDTSNIKDSTTNTNDGVKTGAAQPIEAAGEIYKGQVFDGDEFITVANDATIDITTGDFSIGGWCNLTTDVDALRTIACKQNTAPDTNGFYIRFTTAGHFYGGIDTADPSHIYIEIEDAVNHLATGWHRYYMTVDRDSATGGKLYVDTTNTATSDPTTAAGTLTNTNSLFLGVHRTGTNLFFKGGEDEVRLYTRALSTNEIATGFYNETDALITYEVEDTDAPTVSIGMAWATAPFADTPTWTDVSADLLSFDIRRGRQHELDRFESGVATVILNNDSGDYWPSDSVDLGRKSTIRAIFNGTLYFLYTGYIESIKPAWIGGGGLGSIMRFDVADAISIFSRTKLNSTTGYNVVEASGTRIGKVLTDCGFPVADRTLDTGIFDIIVSGALSNVVAQDYIFDVSDAELGLFYIGGNGYANWESRSHRTISPHTLSQHTFTDTFANIELSLDDSVLYNEVRATRSGGSEQTVADTTSQTDYGIRTLVKSGLLLGADSLAKEQAECLLARYSYPALRVESITIEPQKTALTYFPLTLGYDISTRITIALSQASISTAYFIEGIEHSYSAQTKEWATKWMLSDVARYLYQPVDINQIVRPSGVGANSDNTPNGDTPNWKCVDEVTADDATSYIESDTTGVWCLDTYAHDTYAMGAGTITNVRIYARCRKATGIGATILAKMAVKSGGTVYYSDEKTLTASYADYYFDWATNPNGGAAWNTTTINAAEIGVTLEYDNVGGISTGQCTQVYATVTYTPSW